MKRPTNWSLYLLGLSKLKIFCNFLNKVPELKDILFSQKSLKIGPKKQNSSFLNLLKKINNAFSKNFFRGRKKGLTMQRAEVSEGPVFCGGENGASGRRQIGLLKPAD
jgi:hypothetical protein